MDLRRTWRCGVVVTAGLAVCVLGTGCATAAELGVRFAAAVVEGALKGGARDTNSEPAPVHHEPQGESACRKKLRRWREADGNPRAEPPPHLRCGPQGEWPDESEVLRAGGSSGL